MCFYEKSKMVASPHGSRRLTAEEVLEEVFADRDAEFSDEEDAAPNRGEGRGRGGRGGGRGVRGGGRGGRGAAN